MARRPRKLRRRLLALLISGVVALLIAEIGLRIYAKATHRERGLLYDAELGWRLAPNLTKVGQYWGAEVPAETNSLGWRDVEFGRKRNAGVQRIVALGDSFVFGVGVDYGQRFTELLETDTVEVLNLGVNAYGTDQELRLLETEALDFAPDVVVLAVFFGNDLDDIRHERRFGWLRPHYLLEGGELRLVKPELTLGVRLRTSCYLGELVMRPLGGTLDAPRLAPAWETADVVPLFSALLASMAERVESRGARFLVVALYPEDWLSEPLPEREARARDALFKSGLELLDMRSALSAGGSDLFLPDGHLTPRGHALLADALSSRLRELDWVR